MLAQAPVSPTPVYVIAVYLLLLIVLGLISNRFFKGTSRDYFLVDRNIGPFLLLMSIFGTTMTGFALVGSTGKAYTNGIGVYGMMASWSGLVHCAVFFLVGIRLWAVGKRYGYLTQCEYFRNRFDSPALGYVLFPILVLLIIPYLLVGVIAAGKFLQSTTAGIFPHAFPMPDIRAADGTMHRHPLDGGVAFWLGSVLVCGVVLSYVFFGGLRGAVWANTFQTLVFMCTGVVAFYLISSRLGGLAEAAKEVAASATAGSRLARQGLMGQMQFLSYALIPLSVGMFPHVFQHWLTARNARAFRLTIIAHPIFILIVWLPCVLIGVWGTAVLGTGANPNTVLGRMVGQLVQSPFLTGLVGAGVLAAIMSSLDSQFMCLGTMFTHDIVVRLFGPGRFSDRQKIVLARCFVLGVVLFAFLLSLWLKDSTQVFDLGIWCFSGFTSLFPLVFASIYWKRVTKAGAFASIIVSAVVWSILFYQGILAPEAAIRRGDMLVAGMLPVAVMFGASILALVTVSYLTQPPRHATVQKFFPENTRVRIPAPNPKPAPGSEFGDP